jgi:hypothetical protein
MSGGDLDSLAGADAESDPLFQVLWEVWFSALFYV